MKLKYYSSVDEPFGFDAWDYGHTSQDELTNGSGEARKEGVEGLAFECQHAQVPNTDPLLVSSEGRRKGRAYVVPSQHAVGKLQTSHHDEEDHEHVEDLDPLRRRFQILPPAVVEDVVDFLGGGAAGEGRGDWRCRRLARRPWRGRACGGLQEGVVLGGGRWSFGPGIAASGCHGGLWRRGGVGGDVDASADQNITGRRRPVILQRL